MLQAHLSFIKSQAQICISLGWSLFKRSLERAKANGPYANKTFTSFLDNGDPIEKSIYKKELLIPVYKDEFKPWEIIASSVGHDLLTMVRDVSLLEFVVGKGKTPFYNVVPTKECSNKLTTLYMTSARMPSDFPMVYIPNRWSSVPGGFKYGGYLWNYIKGRETELMFLRKNRGFKVPIIFFFF